MVRTLRLASAWVIALAVISSWLAPAATASIVTGNIYSISNGSGVQIGTTVDHWGFHVNSMGVVTIDVLSMEKGDTITGAGANVDVNGDGEIAYIDSQIYLFHDDGMLDVSDYITENDDSFFTYDDDSIHHYDSFLELTLDPGDYILAIGAFILSQTDAIDQVNEASTFSPYGFDHSLHNDHGDYQITFSGDVEIASAPEPSSLVIWGLGILGIAFAGWRKRKLKAA